MKLNENVQPSIPENKKKNNEKVKTVVLELSTVHFINCKTFKKKKNHSPVNHYIRWKIHFIKLSKAMLVYHSYRVQFFLL